MWEGEVEVMEILEGEKMKRGRDGKEMSIQNEMELHRVKKKEKEN